MIKAFKSFLIILLTLSAILHILSVIECRFLYNSIIRYLKEDPTIYEGLIEKLK